MFLDNTKPHRGHHSSEEGHKCHCHDHDDHHGHGHGHEEMDEHLIYTTALAASQAAVDAVLQGKATYFHDGEEESSLLFEEEVPSFSASMYEPKTGAISEYSFYKGNWTVLFFYPADFTFVCPTEIADLIEVHSKLEAKGVHLFGVSTDTAYSHMIWHKTESLLKGLNFPLLADTTHQISKLFGVFNPYSGMAYRGTIIINPKGEVVGKEIVMDGVGRSSDELVRKIEAYLFTEANGVVCPARWKAGDSGLKKSQLQVGNVGGSFTLPH